MDGYMFQVNPIQFQKYFKGGPHVKGRIVDIPPAKAEKIGLTSKKRVAKVEVVPIEVPMPDGNVKLGAGSKEN